MFIRRNWFADTNKDMEADAKAYPVWAVAVGEESKLVYNSKGNIMVKESVNNGIKFYAITGNHIISDILLYYFLYR